MNKHINLSQKSDPLQLLDTKDDRVAARWHGDLVLLYGALEVFMVFSSATIGGSVIAFVVGPRFGELGGLIAIFGVVETLATLRWIPNDTSTPIGDSRNTLLGCVGRCIGLALAIIAVLRGLPLEAVAGCAVVGEIFGLLCSEWSLFKPHRARIGELATLVLRGRGAPKAEG